MNQRSHTTVLITGASSGLGRGIACKLAEKGHQLILTGRDFSRLEKTRELCHQSELHEVFPFDLNQVATVYESFSRCISQSDSAISGFIHSAGVSSVSPTRLMQTTKLQSVFNVNLIAGMEILRVLLDSDPELVRLKRVLFMSSAAARLGEKGASAYCASKGAIAALVRNLAIELAPNVTVGAVSPGMVRTEMTVPYLNDGNMVRQLADKYPLGIGEVEDIASTVAFLMSSRGNWITGQAFYVDGGRLAS